MLKKDMLKKDEFLWGVATSVFQLEGFFETL